MQNIMVKDEIRENPNFLGFSYCIMILGTRQFGERKDKSPKVVKKDSMGVTA